MDVETDTNGESITVTITVDDERLYREVPLAIIKRSAQIRGNPSSTERERAVVEELDEIGADLLEVLPQDVVDRESDTIRFSVSNDDVFEEVIHGLGIRHRQPRHQAAHVAKPAQIGTHQTVASVSTPTRSGDSCFAE